MLCDSLHLEKSPRLAFGVPKLDDWLGGGLRHNGLHEFYADADSPPSAMGLALNIAILRHATAQSEQVIFWLRDTYTARKMGKLYPLGVTQLGLSPTTFIMLMLDDHKAVLSAALDCVRAGCAAAVVIDLWGKVPALDMITTRRLVLAAEKAHTMVLLLRSHAEPSASIAHSRWSVASAPSQHLLARAPGRPAYTLELLRQRGGRDGLIINLEWDRDTTRFSAIDAAESAQLSGGALAATASRVRNTDWSRAA